MGVVDTAGAQLAGHTRMERNAACHHGLQKVLKILNISIVSVPSWARHEVLQVLTAGSWVATVVMAAHTILPPACIQLTESMYWPMCLI